MKEGEFYNPYMVFHGCMIPNCLMVRKDLTLSAKICFARLAQYSGTSGYCYPSLKQLSDETGTSESTVERAINELIEAKLIYKEIPTGVNKLKHFRNIYRFLWNEILVERHQFGAPIPSKSGYGRPQNRGIKKENHIKENHNINIINAAAENTDLFQDDPPTEKESPQKLIAAKKEQTKKQYLESVRLTDEEHSKLVSIFGEKKLNEAISILNNYKMSSGRKYKSDYHVLIGWVKDRIMKDSYDPFKGAL